MKIWLIILACLVPLSLAFQNCSGGFESKAPGVIALSSAQSEVTLSSLSIAAGDAFLVQIRVIDAVGEPREGEVPVIADDVNRVTCTESDEGGNSECELLLTRAGAHLYRVVEPFVKSLPAIVVAAGEPSTENSRIEISGELLAGGDSSSVQVTLKDEFGNPIEGIDISSWITSAGAAVSSCVASGVDGVAVCSLSSDSAGSKTINVNIGGETLSAEPSFVTTPEEASSVWAEADTAVAGDDYWVSVVLKDHLEQPVVGVMPTLEVSGTGNSVVTACSSTDDTGLSRCRMNSTLAGTREISIATPVVKAGASILIIPADVHPNHSSLSVSGPHVADGESKGKIQIIVKDEFANVIADKLPVYRVYPNYAPTSSPQYGPSVSPCVLVDALMGLFECDITSGQLAREFTIRAFLPDDSSVGEVGIGFYDEGELEIERKIVFEPGPPVSEGTNLTVQHDGDYYLDHLEANGSSESKVSYTFKDKFNNKVYGLLDSVVLENDGLTDIQTCTSINEGAGFECPFTSGIAGIRTIKMSFPIEVESNPIYFGHPYGQLVSDFGEGGVFKQEDIPSDETQSVALGVNELTHSIRQVFLGRVYHTKINSSSFEISSVNRDIDLGTAKDPVNVEILNWVLPEKEGAHFSSTSEFQLMDEVSDTAGNIYLAGRALAQSVYFGTAGLEYKVYLQGVIIKLSDQGNVDANFGDNGFLFVGERQIHKFTNSTEYFEFSRDSAAGSSVHKMKLLEDQLIVTGYVSLDAEAPDQISAFVAKYDKLNGDLDTSFGVDGLAYLNLEHKATGDEVFVLEDGKILLGGTMQGSEKIEVFISRLNSDGLKDPSFGDEGVQILEFPIAITQPIADPSRNGGREDEMEIFQRDDNFLVRVKVRLWGEFIFKNKELTLAEDFSAITKMSGGGSGAKIYLPHLDRNLAISPNGQDYMFESYVPRTETRDRFLGWPNLGLFLVGLGAEGGASLILLEPHYLLTKDNLLFFAVGKKGAGLDPLNRIIKIDMNPVAD